MPPLDIPDVFSQMTISPVASRSRDGGREQATHSQGSGTSGTTFPPAPTPALHRKTQSPPAVVAPPTPLPPVVQGKLRLPLHVICHSRNAQRLMEDRKISWGVQYELARGILAEKWKWEDVTDRVLDRLQGHNAVAAPKVRSVMAEAIGQGNTAYHVDFGTTARELWLVFEPNVLGRCELTALPGLSMIENKKPFLSASHAVWV